MAIIKWSGRIGMWTLCLWVSSALAAFAQGQGVGAIGGIVGDTSGAALPGVTVSLVSSQGRSSAIDCGSWPRRMISG